MKYTLPIVAVAGLASAYVSDYSLLAARGEISDYDARFSLITRALADFDAELQARNPTGSRRGSTASAHSMQSLSRTNSWDSIKPHVDAHGNKQSSGVGRAEGDTRDASRKHQAQNAAQRTVSYAKKNPLEAASSTLSGAGSMVGAAGAIAGAHGNAPIAAGCAAGAGCLNGAANLIDKYRTGKKTAGGKNKRDLLARALMAEIAFGGYPEIEARSYDSYDNELWSDEYLF